MLKSVFAMVKKEFRQRARGWSTLAVLFGYSALLGVVAYISFISTLPAARSTFDVSQIGLNIIQYSFIAQLVITVLLALSYNCAAITTEKQQATFELINLTLFSNQEIILGKFFAITGFNLLLILTALPFYFLAFIFGGFEAGYILYLGVTLLGVTLSVSAIGLLMSLIKPDTRSALTWSFAAVGLLGVVFYFPANDMYAHLFQSTGTAPNVLSFATGLFGLLLNPVFSLRSIEMSGALTSSAQGLGIYDFVTRVIPLPVSSFLFHLLLTWVVLGVAFYLYPKYRTAQVISTGV